MMIKSILYHRKVFNIMGCPKSRNPLTAKLTKFLRKDRKETQALISRMVSLSERNHPAGLCGKI
jgi:hypothetical protein